jgi:hypothetical protein
MEGKEFRVIGKRFGKNRSAQWPVEISEIFTSNTLHAKILKPSMLMLE